MSRYLENPAAKFLTRLSVRPNLKVILTSAYSKEAIATSFSGLRIMHFVRKPFQLSELADVLRDALAD
jgi:DNA-binding NtrC family response regulator